MPVSNLAETSRRAWWTSFMIIRCCSFSAPARALAIRSGRASRTALVAATEAWRSSTPRDLGLLAVAWSIRRLSIWTSSSNAWRGERSTLGPARDGGVAVSRERASALVASLLSGAREPLLEGVAWPLRLPSPLGDRTGSSTRAIARARSTTAWGPRAQTAEHPGNFPLQTALQDGQEHESTPATMGSGQSCRIRGPNSTHKPTRAHRIGTSRPDTLRKIDDLAVRHESTPKLLSGAVDPLECPFCSYGMAVM